MKADWIEALIRGSATLGVPLDADTGARLARFADRLIEWGAKMDLSSITDPKEIREKHFLDSIAGAPILPVGATLVDLGSGAGFPGLVLAAVRPDLHVISVESKSKKGAFQRQVIRDLALANAKTQTERAEDVIAREPAPDFVTARALSDLDALIALVEPWLGGKTILLAYKGAKADAEQKAAAACIARLGLSVASRDLVLPESKHRRELLLVGRDLSRAG